MAERQQPQQVQVQPQQPYDQGGFKVQKSAGGGCPSASKILAVITFLPVGGGLLALSGITLIGTLIGLAVTTPLFLLFSPVLVPAALLVGFAVNAFLTSGAFGLTGVTSLSWFAKYLREAIQAMPERLDQARRHVLEMAGYVDQKTKEMGQEIQKK